MSFAIQGSGCLCLLESGKPGRCPARVEPAPAASQVPAGSPSAGSAKAGAMKWKPGESPRVCAGRQPGHCPSASSVSLQAPSAWLPGLPPGAAPGPLATAAMDTVSLRGLACLLWLLQILVDREPAALADLLFPVRSLPFSFFHSFICSFR